MSSSTRLDVVIVGAGIVGLAHAWAAARRGHRVRVFERSPRAEGASIRNFGMVWPIGQPPGPARDTALLSRDRWLELGRLSDVWVQPTGSLHLAHRPDELAVLEEFASRGPALGYPVQLLTPAEVLRRSPGAQSRGLLGGLWSPDEVAVNPPQAIRTLPGWLQETLQVRFDFRTVVTQVADGRLLTAAGETVRYDRAIVCGGADLESLFPAVLARSGLRRCKLQMLATVPQPAGWRLGTHLASGLTLRHYANFSICPALAPLRARIATETPELDRLGIHVMASQTNTGQVILGDSHEYDDAIEPFDTAEIEELMLRELRLVFDLPDWTIASRWQGIYAKHPDAPVFAHEPEPGVALRTGTGGSGMTMAFGLTERDWECWGHGQNWNHGQHGKN
jgi:FAD dependent oxidoreductase TIGR03364